MLVEYPFAALYYEGIVLLSDGSSAIDVLSWVVVSTPHWDWTVRRSLAKCIWRFLNQ